MKNNESSESYTILIENGEIYAGLSEVDFLDKMDELAQCYYECGYPSPEMISYTENGKTVHIPNRDNNSNKTKEN